LWVERGKRWWRTGDRDSGVKYWSIVSAPIFPSTGVGGQRRAWQGTARSSSDQHQGDPGAGFIGPRAIGRPPSVLSSNSVMSSHQRPNSPPAYSSRTNRSSHHRDRTDRDRRRERDGEHHERDRRDRDERGFDRRDRNSDSKRGARRSASPPSRSSRKLRDSRSKSPSRRRRSRSRSRSGSRRVDGEEGGDKDKDEDKAKPNFGSSGLLAAATKTVKTGEGKDVVLKYHEPPEARKPLLGWRLYVFKGNEQVGGLGLDMSLLETNNHSRRSIAHTQAERVSRRTG